MIHTDIQGWFDWEETYRRWARETPQRGRIVEVGNFKGRSLAFLLEELLRLNRVDVQVYAVDNGEGVGEWTGPTLEKEFRANMKRVGYPKLVIYRKPSLDVVDMFLSGTCDRVWIDGSHKREDVLADMTAWWPRVSAGGEMGGHDYGCEAGVNAAVNAWARDTRNRLEVLETSHAPDEPVRTTSWLFRKP